MYTGRYDWAFRGQRWTANIFVICLSTCLLVCFEAWSLTEPGVYPFGKSGWPEDLEIHLSAYPSDLSS